MFAESKVLSFFPTGVWTHVLAPEDYEPLNARLKTKIYELMAALPDSAGQTRNDLQNLPEFEELVAFMRQATKGVRQPLTGADIQSTSVVTTNG